MPEPNDNVPAVHLEAAATKDTAASARDGAQKRRDPNRPTAVVGLGASAGGIQVLQQFFRNMPGDTGLAFVVVMHLSPDHESNLAEILQAGTAMPVVQVNDTTKVEKNHVYVIPPNKHLSISDGMLVLTAPQQETGRRVTIDLFFRTLAEHYGQRAVCIILSGTDSDGVIGLKHIKAQGGVTIAQEPSEAEHDAMPRHAIETGMVDWVLPVSAMPARLLDYVENERAITLPPEHNGEKGTLPDLAEGAAGGPLTAKETTDPDDEIALSQVLLFLRSQTGHDFSHYKRATVLRRIARRLQVNSLETLPAYLEFLQTHSGETHALLSDLLINVTHFFRDPNVFTALQANLPQLFAGKGPNDQLRVWVPACATGEEAYTLAILLSETANRLEKSPAIQIFATDIDDGAVAKAREGIYPTTIEADVTQERLRRHFFEHHGQYRIKKEVRSLVLFAPHDLLRDAPFSRLDLISCRNLLIYLRPEAQHRAIDIFHFGLRPGGLLVLGNAEGVDGDHTLFASLDQHHRIYVRRNTSRLAMVQLPARLRKDPVSRVIDGENQSSETGTRAEVPEPISISPILRLQQRLPSLGEMHARLIEEYGPPSIVVDENYDIVHMSARAGAYLRFTGGEPSANLLRLVDDSLRLELRTALYRAGQSIDPVFVAGVHTRRDGKLYVVDFRIWPSRVADQEETVFLIMLDERLATEQEQAVPSAPQPHEPVTRHLEEELRQTQERLNATVEHYETNNEELKAANEELQAMNEEMRSATEELETSREELQSVNEELTTLNQELKNNVEELNRANSDLQNLIASTEIATVFLDADLRIERYTPRAQDLFNLIPADLGRPLSHITTKLHYPELEKDIERVLRDLEKSEREIAGPDGMRFLARLSPYRTLDDRINGVVVVFIDITERIQAQKALEKSEEEFRRGVEESPIPMIMQAEDGQVLQISRSWTELTGYTREDMPTFEAWLNKAYGFGGEDVRERMRQSFHGKTPLDRVEFSIVTRSGERRAWSFSASPIGTLRDGRRFVVGMANDITERKRTEETLRISEENYRTLFESIDEGFCVIEVLFDANNKATDYRFLEVNPAFERQAGIENAKGKRMREIAPEHEEHWFEVYGQIALTGEPRRFQNRAQALNRSFDVYAFRVGKPEEHRVAVLFDDISERERTAVELRVSEERFRAMVTQTRSGIVQTDLQGKIIFVNDRFCEMTGYSRAELLQVRLNDITEEEDRARSAELFQRLNEAGEPFTIEKRYRCKDGSIVWVEKNVSPIRNPFGEPESVLAVCLNITQRKAAEEELRESRERYRLLVEGTPDYAMFMLAPENTIIYWSSGAEKVFGWTAEEAIGQSGNLIFTPEDRAKGAVEKEMTIALEKGRAPDRRYHLRKDGSRFWADGVLMRLDTEDNRLRGFAKIARDATEQRRAEDELLHARDELEQRVLERTADLMATNNELERTMVQREQLERELLDISERERRRIGQDLHDVVCQELTATALFLKSAGNTSRHPEAAKSLAEAAEIVNRNVAIARDLARGFQPSVLATGGLQAALRTLCKDANERHGIHCTLKLPRAIRVRDETIALNLFRIAQEAMRNAVSHSGGDEIIICIEREREFIRLVVEDNGKGFRPKKSTKGLGLHIMKYRANVLGGTLTINSRRSGGTKVVCEVPVKK